MSERKLLFFDVDGTLAAWDGHGIPDSALRALDAAKSRGNLLAVNTGRTFRHVQPLVRGLPFDGYVCGLGGHILWQGEDLFYRAPAPALCARVRDLGRECGLYLLFESERDVSCDLDHAGAYAREEFLWLREKGVPARTDVYREGFAFDKFVAWPGPGADPERFCRELAGDFDFIARENRMLEAVGRGLSKAGGVRFLLERLGISREDSYAFGDGPNDLDMLSAAGTGVLMGNAPRELWKYADYVTAPLREDGLARAMEHFGLV